MGGQAGDPQSLRERRQGAGGARGRVREPSGPAVVLPGAGSCCLSWLRRAAKCFLPGSNGLSLSLPLASFHCFSAEEPKGRLGWLWFPARLPVEIDGASCPPVCFGWGVWGRGDWCVTSCSRHVDGSLWLRMVCIKPEFELFYFC